MARKTMVSTRPRIAVQYILDEKKLQAVTGLFDFVKKVRKLLRGMGLDLTEYGPDIDPDRIAANALECRGQHAAFLAVTFTGTSARQTAAIGRFGGPVGVWFFPGTPWWSMASAGSGIGYLRDEASYDPSIRVAAIWGSPDEKETPERLECFFRASHTVFAMRREKIGLIGGSYYEVMPASNWHPDVLTSRLGPSYAEMDMSLLKRAMDEVTNVEVGVVLGSIRKAGMKLPEDDLELDTIRMAARVSQAIEKLQKEYSLTGVAVNCYGSPDPHGYTGVLGRCGANPCLKSHALGSVITGCEGDVIQCAQQMLFRHLVGVVPCMADPWKVDENGELLAGTCSGPAELAPSPEKVMIEPGTLMSLYEVGELGVCFPQIGRADAIVARIAGRNLEKMVVATGEFLGSDKKTLPGRLCLKVRLNDPQGFLERGVIGNHYTFLPTRELGRDLKRLEVLCDFLDIEMEGT